MERPLTIHSHIVQYLDPISIVMLMCTSKEYHEETVKLEPEIKFRLLREIIHISRWAVAPFFMSTTRVTIRSRTHVIIQFADDETLDHFRAYRNMRFVLNGSLPYYTTLCITTQ